MSAPDERVVILGASDRAPELSVVIPFFRYDPSPLLKRLRGAPAGVEIILLDDGSGSATLLSNVISAAQGIGAPVRIIVSENNKGRAAGRNRLVTEARGAYVLFLDADMLPDARDFLAVWLSVLRGQRPRVAFGGLSLRYAARTPQTDLHYNLFGASDCHKPRKRNRAPAQSTASANLLVHRSFLEALPFDNRFKGWGFEDTDWAIRAAQRAQILHVDNPATHAGLDDVDTLMRKSREAGPNFALLAQKHPEIVARFAAHRTARAMQLTPALPVWRAMFAWLTRTRAPMPVRRAALKLYRASHYAEHLA
jgi:glycosyltransferase involved in cell wall biosynthesis